MSLQQKVPAILDYINEHKYFTDFNSKIFDIIEGDLSFYAKKAIKEQIMNPKAVQESIARLSPINILKRLMEKLTKIYSSTVDRRASQERYQEVVDYYVKTFDLNNKMNQANLFFNSTKVASIEPFEHNLKPYLRIVPSHQFLMYSDDIVFPNEPTVYIKFMGEFIKKEARLGSKEKKCELYFLYSDTEFLAVDSEGEVQTKYMEGNEGINSYKVIPATYANKSEFLLIPKPDEDLIQMTILIVLLLTDINYAVKYQAHSLIYGMNLDMQNIQFNPDTFINFKSDQTGQESKIGVIKPEIDIEQVINLIMTQIDAWFESRNIKSGSAGKLTGDNFNSGISLMIKELDTSNSLKDQITAFTEIERSFWHKMIKIHNYWVANGVVKGLPLLPDDFEVAVSFELPKPMEDEDKKLDRALKGLNKVYTLEDALKMVFPKYDQTQIEKAKLELLKEQVIMEPPSIEESESFLSA